MNLLEQSLKIDAPSITENAGIIQFFEMAFELGWKTLKDYFEVQGLNTKFPRETIKTAIEKDIIKDGDKWMEAMTDRNLTAHTYDEKTALKVTNDIKNKYFPLLKQLETFLSRIED